jgi:hypothetical protein
VAIAPIRNIPTTRTQRINGHPSKAGASYIDILQGRFRRLFGQLLNSLRIPGTIRAFHFNDPVSHQTIDIRVGDLFTKITVDGRDYYFHRLTGKFDGTGMGCG